VGLTPVVRCSALPTMCIGAARAWTRTITSKRFHTLRRASTHCLFTLPLTLPLAHAGLGKPISRLHLHDSISYSLRMLAARSIVSGLYLLPRSSCKPRTTFQLLQCPFHLELLLLRAYSSHKPLNGAYKREGGQASSI
jgi:hypothetical protein